MATSLSPQSRPTEPQPTGGGLAPGLTVAVVGALLAMAVGTMSPSVSVAMVAVAIGALAGNLGLVTPAMTSGLAFASQRLLRVGVVLLGLRLSLGDVSDIGARGLVVVAVTVAATFLGTQVLGRRLGLSPDLSLLVATGYAICGVSAIAAVRDATTADDEEVATAMGLVTIYGSLAMITLPVVATVVGLSDATFGLWAGASVHDVAQVVATASAVGPTVVGTAVAVKLTRVALLVPIVLAVNVAHTRRVRGRVETGDGTEVDERRRPVLPLFVVGFVAAVILRTTGLVPADVIAGAREVERVLFAVALVGLGAGIRIARLRRLGPMPLVFGLLAWLLVAAVALAGALWSLG